MTIDFSQLSDSELSQLITDATRVLSARAPQPPDPLRYTTRFGSYNARRYSRPWIARVTAWPIGGKPELAWGGYCGDDSGGEAEILARPGDIIRYGQRDGRGNNGENAWAIAQEDGSLRIVSQSEARAQYR